MAAHPQPPLQPGRAGQRKQPTETTTGAVKNRFFVMMRSVADASTLQERLSALMKKRWLRVLGIAVAVLIVILIALPFLINVNRFRPKIESEATNALGRPVKLGKLSLSILAGTVGIEDISIADDPAFSKSPFVTAKSLKVGVELMPLMLSKQLNVTAIELDEKGCGAASRLRAVQP